MDVFSNGIVKSTVEIKWCIASGTELDAIEASRKPVREEKQVKTKLSVEKKRKCGIDCAVVARCVAVTTQPSY